MAKQVQKPGFGGQFRTQAHHSYRRRPGDMLFHPWGREPEGGVVRPWRSLSHVVGQGHLLTSGWVPLGPVRARRGAVWVRILVVH